MAGDKFLKKARKFIESSENIGYWEKERIRSFAVWLDLKEED